MIAARNLNSQLANLNIALHRFVEQLGVSSQALIRQQAGLLQADMVSAAPPKNKSRLLKQIKRDVGNVFASKPRSPEKGAEMVWLASGPKWVVGVDPNFFRPQESVEGMRYIYRTNRGKMGKRFTDLGLRGKQAVRRLNRFVVSKSTISKFAKLRQSMVGGLKASFAVAWYNAIAAPKRARLPAWIQKILQNRKAKGTFINATNNKTRPQFTIVSRAPGCSSPAAIRIARWALVKREKSIVNSLRVLVRLRDKGKWSADQFNSQYDA